MIMATKQGAFTIIQRGFTLLELLVALAVFAIAGTAVMHATSGHLQGVTLMEEHTLASWVAANRMAEVHIEKKWPPQNNKKGKLTMASREWHWLQNVKKTEDDSLRQVTVVVAATENDLTDNPIMSVTSYLGRPK
ncbi:type II secretion system minor pseudopilin GspI [Flocculibacter collagenilyticus]|uniref:type II secretion system minor pseudopilin GspI n=1 Tax=Flocculibacter collagenilyticus TaxID=2744479 RepID=UPI001F35B882|nr:type II secretion system minor pseudopilin GspI [Flocculibacter collagenilyticus]